MKQRARLDEAETGLSEKLDVGGFAPREAPRGPGRAVLREAAAAAGWAPPARRGRRQTGRSDRIDVRVKPEARAAFYAIADEHGWNYGEAMERIIAAWPGKGE